MNYELTEEFINITKDILINEHFNKLKDDKHHGTTRYDHSLRVALNTYNYYKKKNHKYLYDITRRYYSSSHVSFNNYTTQIYNSYEYIYYR